MATMNEGQISNNNLRSHHTIFLFLFLFLQPLLLLTPIIIYLTSFYSLLSSLTSSSSCPLFSTFFNFQHPFCFSLFVKKTSIFPFYIWSNFYVFYIIRTIPCELNSVGRDIAFYMQGSGFEPRTPTSP